MSISLDVLDLLKPAGVGRAYELSSSRTVSGSAPIVRISGCVSELRIALRDWKDTPSGGPGIFHMPQIPRYAPCKHCLSYCPWWIESSQGAIAGNSSHTAALRSCSSSCWDLGAIMPYKTPCRTNASVVTPSRISSFLAAGSS